MNVLIVGSTGFIGSRLASAFAATGHAVTCAARHPDVSQRCHVQLSIDYLDLPPPDKMRAIVSGFDVVINAVGILRPQGAQTFEALHTAGPRALFDACAAAGVRRVIQVSALGAHGLAESSYHRSKYAADLHLATLPLDWVVVQPSLVYGAGGASARLFDTLASLPVTLLPAGGNQLIQPVHIADLVAAVVALAESPAALRCVLPVAGPQALTLAHFLRTIRQGFGREPARELSIPAGLMRVAARAGEWWPGSLLTPESWRMLERGNTTDASALGGLLGRPARHPAQFIAPQEIEPRRLSATLVWLAPLLRLAVAAMWLIAAIVSAGLYPTEHSLALLQGIGIPANLAPIALRSAIGLDLVMAFVTLWPHRARWIWSAQIVLVLTYTVIITVWLPALWLDPFGPVAKNIPILALLLLLRQIERRA